MGTDLDFYKPGIVLNLFCEFTEPNKEKFLVLVAIDPQPLFLVINSEINEFKKSRKRLLESQVIIKSSEHPFLDHNSYVDCSQAIEYFNFKEIRNQIDLDNNRIKSEISLEVRKSICNALRNSFTMIKRHKIWAIKSLECDNL